MRDYIKVRAASPRVHLANPAANAKSVVAAVLNAQAAQIDALVLPELFLSGYTCGDLFRQDALLAACEAALNEILRQTAETQVLCAFGLPVRIDDRLYNCAAVARSGELLGVVPKTGLSYSEKCWFADGANITFEKKIFKLPNGLNVGINIGENFSMLSETQLILNLSAVPALVGKHEKLKEKLRQYSAQNGCVVAYASAGAGESTTDMVYSGACAIAENGDIVAEGERFCLGGTHCDAKVNLSAHGRKSSSIIDANMHVSSGIAGANPFVPEDEHELKERCDEILKIQSAGLAQRILHTGSKRLVLGLSGGLDSTLALIVCVKTCKILGRPLNDILCVSMPGFGTTARTKNNAKVLALAVGAEYREIDITAACIQHMHDIGHDMSVHDITYENTQARERTQILMNIANACGGLVIGTGTLSELALGWCTYNADHMSMYAVNSGVPKTLVKHIINAECRMQNAELVRILKDIINTPVSPELLPPDEDGNISQKTEEILGDYAVHDFYLYHFLRSGIAPRKLLDIAKNAFDGVYDEENLRKWLDVFLRRFFSQQFKRSCMPDSVKVGSVSLSPRGEWVMPSDAMADIWIDKN